MFAGADREQLRRAYAEAWRKGKAGTPLEPLEAAIVDVLAEHPEYHAVVESPQSLGRDFPVEDGETNPFLHLGMHLAIREQVATDRPPGIRDVHRALAGRAGAHAAEHRMMECLGEAIWEAQRDGRPPDEERYLESLRRLA